MAGFAPANAEREARAREKRGAESSGEASGGLGEAASPVESEGDLGAVVSAGGDAAASPSAPMSAPDFETWRETMNVTDDMLAEAWAEVIVGKTKLSQLTDLDRGELRDALAVRLTREAVKA